MLGEWRGALGLSVETMRFVAKGELSKPPFWDAERPKVVVSVQRVQVPTASWPSTRLNYMRTCGLKTCQVKIDRKDI